MGVLDEIWSKLVRSKDTTSPAPTNSTLGMPVKRISVPDDYAPMMIDANGVGMFNFISPRKWPIEVYDIITNITISNPDLRQAVGHVVQLGNTGHMVNIKGNNEAGITAAIDRIQSNGDAIFPFNAGTEGLLNSLFAQCARSGAVSTEWVPRNDLRGIEKVFLVPVRDIRWVPRKDNMGYFPVQVPKTGALPLFNGFGTGIVLNPKTYFYSNIERLEDSPYAVPPFIAAIEPYMLQKHMLKSIHKVMKKVGVMGLMTYKVAPPIQRPGETEEKYHARCLAYLKSITDQLKDSFGDGIAAGFQGAFDFDVKAVAGDARGVAEMFKLNEEQLFSAIGADPAMHGRTYSTTETYASVVFSKMIAQLTNYQRVVAKSLEFGWGLDLLLQGIAAEIGVSFNRSEALSNLQEAQTEMINIANAAALYQEGVIDQQQKANRLGYPVPAEAEPRPDPALAGSVQDKNLDQRGGGAANTGNAKKKQPKEQTAHHFKYNKAMKRYEFVMPEIVINTFKGETKLAERKKPKVDDAEMQARFARYL